MQQPVGVGGTTSAEARIAPMAWVGLGILLLISMVAFLDRQIVSLMVGSIKTDLELSDSQIGILQGAAFGLAYPLFAIPFGYASDRFSRRWVIFAGMVFWCVAATLSGLAGSFSTLLFARIGVGIGEAALGPAAVSLLGDNFPRHRFATVMSIFATGSLLGSAVALALGGAIIHWAGAGVTFPVVGELAAWQAAFILTGVPGLLIAFLVFLVPEKRRTHGGASVSNAAPWSEVMTFMRENARFLTCYILGFALLQAATWASLAWLPSIMERSYGLSVVEIGTILAIFTIAIGVPGQLGNGITVDRLFARGMDDAHLRYYSILALIAALCGALAPLANSPYIYLLICVPLKYAMNFGGVQQAAVQVITPNNMRGRIAAICGTLIATIGGTTGPSIIAFFTDYLFADDKMVIWSLALAYAIFLPLGALCFLLGMKPMRMAVEKIRLEQQA